MVPGQEAAVTPPAPPSPPRFTDRLAAGLASWLGVAYLRLVVLTSRFRVHVHPAAQALIDGRRPCVFAFWHRYQLLMAYARRREGIVVLVSRSRDGELIAQTLHRLGYRTARGSSTRGGAAALKALFSALRGGGQLGVTPDGPRGPYRSLQPGLTAVAQRTGAPIVPGGWAGTRVKELRSWDRFLVPLPFGRYEVVFDAPVVVDPDDPSAEDKVRAALDAAPERARALLSA